MSTRRAPFKRIATCVALATLAAAASLPAQGVRRERSGVEVYDAVCASCHASGAEGAPRVGDNKAWAARASKGLGGLTASALTGIRKMPRHGGNPGVSDIEIERAVVHMVNQSGGHWVMPLGGATPAVVRTGEQIVQTQCASCHKDGVDGAPKIGDRAAWVPRLSKGLDVVVKSAAHGHGGMPARGGLPDLSEAELESAIVHMFNHGVRMPPPQPPAARTAPDPFHKVVGGADVYLGVTPAKTVPAGQYTVKVPTGKDDYHVNISLFDATTKSAITDAKVQLKVSDPFGAQTKTLQLISSANTISYGGFFKIAPGNPVQITAEVQRPGAAVERTSFEYRAR